MIPLVYLYTTLYQNQLCPPNLPVLLTPFVADRFSIARVGIPNQFSIPNWYSPLQFYPIPLLYLLFQPKTNNTLLIIPPSLQADSYLEFSNPYKFAVLTKVAVPCICSAVK